jgi:cysteinyl-tRNA synthetase
VEGLGPPPEDGPWAAPRTLEAPAAGDRPDGIAAGDAGHGGDEGTLPRVDRGHAPNAPLSPAGLGLHERFVEALDADLDLPAALAVVREIARSSLPPDERRWLLLDADLVFGLDLHRSWDRQGGPEDVPELDADAAALVAARSVARAERDYARSDALRAELAGMGIEVTDAPDGTSTVRRVAVTKG